VALAVAASASAIGCGTSGGPGQGPGSGGSGGPSGSGGSGQGSNVCGAPANTTQAATIHVTASTNSPEIFVAVYCDGSAERTLGDASSTNVLNVVPKTYEPNSPDVLTFLTDLDAVGDVSAILASHAPVSQGGDCGKSVSFGTITTITAQGKTSGDMQCIQDATPSQTALASDCRVLAPWP
jgi:hypothetical protein